MKVLHFDYRFKIGYSHEVNKCFYTIKCIPWDTKIQKLQNWKVEFVPDTDHSISKDGFGNKQFIGCVEVPHRDFSFRMYGDVCTGIGEYEYEADEMAAARYRYPTALVKPGDRILAFYASLKLLEHQSLLEQESQSTLERVTGCMEKLYESFHYVSKVTDITTSAEDAMALGQGVCQDYAQIMISLCQLLGIPARYVAGMMLGEGASHAWLEIYDGEKWIGVDPTNNQLVNENYIKLGIGRDASDCAINRGLIMGNGGDQTLDIIVNVTE